MDSEHLRLGEIITGDQQRDAVHVAVIPMESGDAILRPGDKVTINSIDGKAYLSTTAGVGVVDPFLLGYVEKGQRFWLFMYPGSITSLRHEWTHPIFPGVVSESERWLRAFALACGVPYEGMMEQVKAGDSVWVGDNDTSYEWRTEFLFHAQVVLGEKFTEQQRDGIYFRCAC